MERSPLSETNAPLPQFLRVPIERLHLEPEVTSISRLGCLFWCEIRWNIKSRDSRTQMETVAPIPQEICHNFTFWALTCLWPHTDRYDKTQRAGCTGTPTSISSSSSFTCRLRGKPPQRPRASLTCWQRCKEPGSLSGEISEERPKQERVLAEPGDETFPPPHPSQWSLMGTSMEEQMKQNYSENICLLYTTTKPSRFSRVEQECRENIHFFPLHNPTISIQLHSYSYLALLHSGGGRGRLFALSCKQTVLIKYRLCADL